jgi:RNA polymerase sigma-70 factor (ECF subfamily)
LLSVQGGENSARNARPRIYCLIPRELAGRLHELLRRHFRDDPGVEVIVERRGMQRRVKPSDKARTGDQAKWGGDERRIGERRAASVAVAPVELPRAARRYAEQLTFVERLELPAQQVEDVDTERLIARIQAGEGELFASLYTRYFDRVYTYLRLMLRDAAEAEDVTQAVFLSIFQALPRYQRRREPFRAWLFTIARNRAINQLEKTSRLEPADPAQIDRHREAGEPPVDLAPLEWISDRELLLFVERMPTAQRQVLLLRYMLDLGTGEIAAVLGRSPDDVRALQSRALRFLRARLTSLGRAPSRACPQMRRRRLQAPVLRSRRFALSP